MQQAPPNVQCASVAHLEFQLGERRLFDHLLKPGRTLVGRSDRCDVALPSDSISRVHCLIEKRSDGWWVVDRSRNGTFVDDDKIERALLTEGTVIMIGDYTARFRATRERTSSSVTTTRLLATVPHSHEDVVEISGDQIATSLAVLRFTEGPHKGRITVIRKPLTFLGGTGADVELEQDLPREGVALRVSRGRLMVQPMGIPVMLAGARVRHITPAMPGEELRINEHVAQVELRTEREDAGQRSSFGQMIGRSPVARKTFGVLARMAMHDMPVLICGESGTGKELAARALHDGGLRSEAPFEALNCAAISEKLFESELFGHEKGAFTGATQRQDGAFQRAHGGTLFLDEVGELQLEFQAKLLRALESGEVRRVGAAKPEFPDVRVVAATNRNLPRMVQEGTFREDLYFRLSVLTIGLPPLRERRTDIPLIAETLLARNHPGTQLAPDAIDALLEYEWPGNVRELRNVLTRAFVLSEGVIHAGDLTFNPWTFQSDPQPASTPDVDPEKRALEDALRACNGNRTQAARELGMPRSSLLYKIRKYAITL